MASLAGPSSTSASGASSNPSNRNPARTRPRTPRISPFSQYPHSLAPRTRTHDSILRPVSRTYTRAAHAARSAGAGAVDASALRTIHSTRGGSRPGPSYQPRPPGASASASTGDRVRAEERAARRRAERRALRGLRPAGVGVGKEGDELSDEERVFEEEREYLNGFGHRFLLPYGRRQTQSEMDHGPQSPTPSQDADDRRQEDRMGGSSPPHEHDMGAGVGDMTGGEEDGAEHDLDASIEDMDGDDADEEEDEDEEEYA